MPVTVQQISGAGLIPAYVAAAAGGDVFQNDGRTMFHVKNGGASAVSATFSSTLSCDQGSTHDVSVTVAAGAAQMIGPFPTARFNDAFGNINISYNQTTSVTVAAIRMPG